MDNKIELSSEHKKEKILKAAIEEFAENGYDKASTNKIVESAGVSKGILFHYFKNKKGLYLYIFDNYFSELYNEVLDGIGEQTELFEKLKGITISKIRAKEKHPILFKFYERAYIDSPKALKKDMEERFNKLREENLKEFFSGIDFSKFKEGVNIELSLKIVNWSLEKYADEYIAQNTDSTGGINYKEEQLIKDIDDIVTILKYGFYK